MRIFVGISLKLLEVCLLLLEREHISTLFSKQGIADVSSVMYVFAILSVET